MKILKNGILLDMTPELEEAWKKDVADAPSPEPTPDERIAALEEELKATKALLGLEV